MIKKCFGGTDEKIARMIDEFLQDNPNLTLQKDMTEELYKVKEKGIEKRILIVYFKEE